MTSPFTLSAQNQLIETLFAPPPPTVTGAAPDDAMTALGGSGMLGDAGRFIANLSRLQEARRQEQEAASVATEIGALNPLDENYDQRVTEIQNRAPMAFATRPVQAAWQRSQRAKGEFARQQEKEARQMNEQRKLQAQQFVRKASPEQLAQLEEEMPDIAAAIGPDMEKRIGALGEAETLYQQLPPAVRVKVDPNNPLAVKKAVNQFQQKVPAVFGKIKSNPDEMMNAIGAAERVKALLDKQKQDGYAPPQSEYDEIAALQEGLETTLGQRSPNLDAIIQAKPLVESDPLSDLNPLGSDGGIKPWVQDYVNSIR